MAKYRVAVVGAGPSGKAASRELIKAGFEVTILEREPETGGLLRYGYPDWRMPAAVSRRDAGKLAEMGVTVRTGVELGKNVRLDELRRDYDAVLLAMGSSVPRALGIPGERLPGVFPALRFLHDARAGRFSSIGSRIHIVGGGDTAMDVATTAASLDATDVRITYRRSAREMPAQSREVDLARKAGARLNFLRTPRSIEAGPDRLRIHMEELRLGEPDDSGRRTPRPTGKTVVDEADSVIVAIGQEPDHSRLNGLGVTLTGGGRTNLPRVYALGELSYGSARLAQAILDGRRAARVLTEDFQAG